MQSLIIYLERNYLTCISIIIALVFSSGIIYSIKIGDKLRYSDEKDYVTLATNVANYNIYSFDGQKPTAFRAPGYPLLISLLLKLNNSILTIRIFNYVILSLSLLLLADLVKIYHSHLASILAVLIGGICSPIIFYTTSTFYPQILSSYLLIFSIYTLFKFKNNIKFLFAGIFFGLTILTVPSFVFAFGFSVFWLIFTLKKKALIPVSMLTLAMIMAIAPWSYRNYVHFNSIPFVCTSGGRALLIGNSEFTTPLGVNTLDKSYVQQSKDMNEIVRDKWYRQQAINYILNNPWYTVKKYLYKFINYFSFSNRLATDKESSLIKSAASFLSYIPLLLFGLLLRVTFARKYPLSNFEVFVILLYVLNGLFAAIFFTRIRLRVPFDLMLVGTASIFIAHALKGISQIVFEDNKKPINLPPFEEPQIDKSLCQSSYNAISSVTKESTYR
jgi:hypothetical protein